MKQARQDQVFSTARRSFSPLLAAAACSSLLLLGACAGTPAADTASADEECVYVRVTGSNLPIKECRSRAEREAIAAANQQAVQNSVRDIQQLDEFGDQSFGADSLVVE